MRETELLIVGGGPAGCAAAVMASSVGTSSVLIEPRQIAHKLNSITSVVNVLGEVSTGVDLAQRIARDVERAARCDVILGDAAATINVADSGVSVVLASGATWHAPRVVVATGVRPQALAETPWTTAPPDLDIPALWDASPADLQCTETLVFGADRPLGTLLRTHRDLETHLLVFHPPAERYKIDEIVSDSRVAAVPTRHAEFFRDQGATAHVRIASESGQTYTYGIGRAYANLGSLPVVPAGDLQRDASGYCPSVLQHPRVLTAGDMRSARFQRIMTAFGSGADAALTAFYAAKNVKT